MDSRKKNDSNVQHWMNLDQDEQNEISLNWIIIRFMADDWKSADSINVQPHKANYPKKPQNMSHHITFPWRKNLGRRVKEWKPMLRQFVFGDYCGLVPFVLCTQHMSHMAVKSFNNFTVTSASHWKDAIPPAPHGPPHKSHPTLLHLYMGHMKAFLYADNLKTALQDTD